MLVEGCALSLPTACCQTCNMHDGASVLYQWIHQLQTSQARLLPALLSALWTMAKLQYDPGAELMQAGAQLLTAEAGQMVTQASLL